MTAFQQQLEQAFKTLKQAKWVNQAIKSMRIASHFPALQHWNKDLFTLRMDSTYNNYRVVTRYTYRPTLPLLYEGGRFLDEIELKDLLLPLYAPSDRSK